jgi:amino acid transporter
MEATTANGPASAEGTDLRRTALGVPDIVFFIVAASAPLTVVAGGVASTYLVTGNAGVPLLFLVLGAILALFVTGYAAMSHHITNAGAFYAYVSKGIGKVAGVGTSFVALIAYNAMQIGILGLFGAVFSGFMLDKADINFAWYTWVFIAIAVIGILGWLRVDLNAKVLAIFLTAEILVVAVFDLVVLGDPLPGGGLSSDGFDPSIAFGAGLGSALCFTMAAFVGFESAAIYGEECKDPRRTVARATYIALGITSLFYAFSAWMLQGAVGASVITDPAALVEGGFVSAPDTPDPTSVLFITLDVRLSTTIADIATLLFCTSLFAASLSFHNAVARYFFALGRARVIPSVFARTNRGGAPFIGSLTQTIIAATVVAIFALSDNDPVLQLFTWLTNLGAMGVILLLALASFAIVGYFRKIPHSETAWTSQWAPALAGLALTAVLILVLANFNLLITGVPDAPTDDRSIILPAILFGGGIVGLVVGALIRSRRPDIYERIGEMGEEEVEAPPPR